MMGDQQRQMEVTVQLGIPTCVECDRPSSTCSLMSNFMMVNRTQNSNPVGLGTDDTPFNNVIATYNELKYNVIVTYTIENELKFKVQRKCYIHH